MMSHQVQCQVDHALHCTALHSTTPAYNNNNKPGTFVTFTHLSSAAASTPTYTVLALLAASANDPTFVVMIAALLARAVQLGTSSKKLSVCHTPFESSAA
jgi:hypothetical protein